ncbi:MAG: zinc-ribbon domain-containing protein [Candidatus Limnocylindrales bacterium]
MASLFCPVCGTENPPTRLFCRKCASDLHAPVPDQTVVVEPEEAPVPVRPILIGIGVAALLIALLLGALALLGGSPTASPSPAPLASDAPSAAITAAPTSAPVETPTETVVETEAAPTPEETTSVTPVPGDSVTPAVDSLSGPRSASCTADNGTGTPGYIRLTWKASGTTGVRLSIDPPAPNKAYDYGYDDYPASGTADLPFTCDPPNSDSGGSFHTYVATTVHDGGYFAWRLVKVYLKP